MPSWAVSNVEVITSRDVPLGAREEWEGGSERFGRVEGYGGQVQRLPAPPMPTVRLKPRLAPPSSAWG